MSFGLIGLFRRVFATERRGVRYLSDASYWMYVVHLPLIMAAQWLVRDWSVPADALVEQAETRATVRGSIPELPAAYRSVLLLRDIEERSTRDVADALEITPAAVKTRLHRARQALSTLLRRRYVAMGVTSPAVAASNN